MACGSGCCRPTWPPENSDATSPEQIPVVESPIQDDRDELNGCYDQDDLIVGDTSKETCCGNNGLSQLATIPLHNRQVRDAPCSEPSEQARRCDCCDGKSFEISRTACVDNCCGGHAEKTQGGIGCGTKDNTTADRCCAPNSTDHGCEKSRWSVPEPPQVEDGMSKPSCCEEKTSPCCDVSCLERLALRECENEKPAAQPNGVSGSPAGSCVNFCGDSRCHGGRDGKPCSHHTRKARERYGATLEALGCICRTLLALGQESCCLSRGRLSGERKRCSKTTSFQRASINTYCTTGASTCKGTSECSAKKRPSSKRNSRDASPRANDPVCFKGCCATPRGRSIADTCVDACCGEENVEKPKETFAEMTPAVDPEKGLSGKEHVILSVSGMTCTGCETKLKRTLATIKSVKNLKTSLVLARAEFDLDLGLGSLAEVMKHLERTTEFKCEKVTNHGSTIDLMVPCDSTEFINQPWPDGVTEMKVVDKRVVNVAFDAKTVGARDLIEKGWGFPLSLAAPRGDPTLEVGSRHVRHIGCMTLLSIMLTIPVLVMAWAPLPKHEIAYSSASLSLATIVQFAVAGPFYSKALKSLIFSRMIEMDLLIVLSTSAAYIFSVVSFCYLVAGQPLSTGEFFETSTLLVTLIMVGRYVSALARHKAVESISIRSLQTSTAVLMDKAGEGLEIDVRLLQYGDVFRVVPDTRIPTDGTVISGSSEVDESMITGESRPVEKFIGSTVIAGSINGSGMLNIRLTRLAGDNTISTILGMVDEAKLSKPKVQDIADRVASYFVPVVVAITIITFVIWVAIGVGVREQSGADATIQAITYAITVLIVSCPCAIGLAVPMVIVVASGIAAEQGVIFKSADSIEVACKTSHVVFDKTGTLTQGKLTVARGVYTDDDSNFAKSLLLGLVGSVKHPVSAAVTAHLKAQGVSASAVSDQRILTGKGVEGTSSSLTLRAGNSHWLNLSSDPRVQPVLSEGYTAFCFTVNDSLAAIFALEDSLRPEAASTVMTLREHSISVHIVSGDDDGAVRSVANLLDIPDTNVRSRCSPADKRAYIRDLLAKPDSQSSSNKSKKPIVVFCGDGTNDAVALSQATIGVHMNEGTDIAKSAADVVLMRPSLTGVLTAIAISKKSSNRIKFNFGWSFVYNLFAILLGAGAFVNARIPPEFAGLGELVSVLPVIAAAVLLRFSKS